MNITGMGSVGSDLYATLGKAGVSTKGQTVAQIRDQVDTLALSGQLTDEQQRHLIEDGLQDMNAADKTYQRAGQTGPQRSDTQPIDLVKTLQGYSAWAQGQGDRQAASTYQSLIDLFEKDGVGGATW